MGVRRLLGSGATVVAFALMTSPASAAQPSDLTVSASGALIYTWHGDSSRGCARVGVCGIQGALIVRALGAGDLSVEAPRNAVFAFGDTNATVRVRRTEGSSEGDCVDTDVWPNSGFEPLSLSWRSSGRARIELPTDQGPSSGRCAGPLSGDLPAFLPGHKLSGQTLSFSFAGTVKWAAGPYSGALISTLVLHSSARSGSGGESGGGTTPPPTANPPTRRVLDERVTVTYRVTAAPGEITARLRGEPDAFCAALDSCGTSGTLALAFAGRQGTMTIIGDRIVRHRVNRAQALADFRAGRLDFGLPSTALYRRFSVSETLDRSGGATCADNSPTRPASVTWLGSPFIDSPSKVRLHSVPVVLGTLGSVDAFLRTRCPGPDGSDLFGDSQILAQGRIGLAHLLARNAQVVLHPAMRFSAPGYVGSFTGGLHLKIAVTKVTAKTIRVPA